MWESSYALPACVVASGLLLLDNAHIAQTRLIYLDAILVFALACSVLCYIKFSRLKNRAFSKEWCTWLFLTGLALSCYISTKYTGLFGFVAVGTAVAIDLWELFDINSRRVVSMLEFAKHVAARLLALVVIPFMLYLFWFWIHFAILSRSGEGDDYMSLEFVDTLRSNATVGRTAKTMSFFQKWYELQGLMFEYNGYINDKHPYESRPWQWPFSLGGVSFWESDKTRQQIFFLGNIPGWWIASSLLAVFVIVVVVDQLFLGRGIHLIQDRMFNLTSLEHTISLRFSIRNPISPFQVHWLFLPHMGHALLPILPHASTINVTYLSPCSSSIYACCWITCRTLL